MSVWNKFRKRIRAFIPRYVPDSVVLAFYRLLSVFSVSKRVISENAEWNRKQLETDREGIYAVCGFLENQEDWNRIKFGKKGDVAKAGCGVIATYNALYALYSEEQKNELRGLLPGIISSYEKKGAAIGGRWGIAPHGIVEYFKTKGYRVCVYRRRTDDIEQFGTENDVLIATAYNDRDDILDQLHTVCITKSYDRYYLHNAATHTTSQLGYDSLTDAVKHISNTNPMLISLIGVNRPFC